MLLIDHDGAFHVRHDPVEHRHGTPLGRARILNGVDHDGSAQRSQEVLLLAVRALDVR